MGKGPFYIAASLTAASVEGQISQLTQAVSDGATLVEIRLDALTDLDASKDIATLLQARTVPAIVSYRSKAEGGLSDATEDSRISALKKAFSLGADFVEVELAAAANFVSEPPAPLEAAATPASGFVPLKSQVVAASYYLDSTPTLEELSAVADKLQATGAGVIKIVTTAQDISDNKRLFDLLATTKVPTIAVALGPRGELSRLLAPKYGSMVSYAYLPEQDELPTVHDYAKVYQGQRISASTKVFGVIGKPISQSRGYLLYNAAMIEKGFDGVYLPFLVDDVEVFFKTFTDFAGFSVTAPHKQWAIKLLDKVDPAAVSIGAVSAIFRETDGTLTGYNMDWGAAVYAVEEGLRVRESLPSDGPSPLEGRLMVLVGAGGAGRGLAYGAELLKGRLVVADLDLGRAQEVADTFKGNVITLEELRKPGAAAEVQNRFGQGLSRAPVLCHATPVGMKPNVDQTPFTQEALEGWAVVFDAVYNPEETRLQREAKSAGATPVSGVEMFVREAEEQFTLFTSGIPAPGKVMRDVLLENLRST
eukprot:TRINITY_DN23260_c0_g1_i1.p1 TRINITY_DN23260_c0_g1~~TRINITY_DN23260_c0_g1_i1.p1  ORF type:complete len:535 (-),score=109.47 TRINITY_DN23260_c0_g1_i1:925-2529(-)